MKPLPFLLLLLVSIVCLRAQDAATRRANTVVLDAAGVQNLRIQTEMVEPRDFEETIFALGRIELQPGSRAVISSRIPGRALEVRIQHDHPVSKGDVAIVVESRQIGDPPPQVSLVAPISGLVSATHVVPGEPVDPDKVLAEIVDLTHVYALARVPEHLAGQLKPGQTAHITVAAVPGEIFTAELEHIGTLADAENGTVEAAFHVENSGLRLRPGMRAEFSIVVNRRNEVTSVPRAALQGPPSNRFVYVKDFELPHAFVKTPVVVGQTNHAFVEIVSGLFPADEVVTQGAYSLAFAGSGTLSLKEALDAAHGHEHNADGSEMTSAGSTDDHHDHDHEHGTGDSFWKIISGVLFLALLVVGFSRRPAARAES